MASFLAFLEPTGASQAKTFAIGRRVERSGAQRYFRPVKYLNASSRACALADDLTA
jgi:hypothetical protein